MTIQKTINKIQTVEMDLLKQIDRICRAHDLTYFAIGGSALGAMRHQGFIPWDDDIDIGMPRADYEAFCKYAVEELPEGYHLQNYNTECESPFYFTKIRKDNTRFVEFYLKDYHMHHGIFADIFPFDHVPRNKVLRNVHFYFCRVLHQLYISKSLTTVCSSRFEKKDNHKSRIRKILHFLLRPVPKSWLFHCLDRSVQMFNGRETNELSHIVRRRLRVFVKDLYPIRYLPFGEIEIPVPNDCDAYLRAQYGTYDIVPPADKQYGHLPYLVEFDRHGGPK